MRPIPRARMSSSALRELVGRVVIDRGRHGITVCCARCRGASHVARRVSRLLNYIRFTSRGLADCAPAVSSARKIQTTYRVARGQRTMQSCIRETRGAPGPARRSPLAAPCAYCRGRGVVRHREAHLDLSCPHGCAPEQLNFLPRDKRKAVPHRNSPLRKSIQELLHDYRTVKFFNTSRFSFIAGRQAERSCRTVEAAGLLAERRPEGFVRHRADARGAKASNLKAV